MKKKQYGGKQKKVGFYFRAGSTSFGCILPDESDKLRKFFADEEAKQQKEKTFVSGLYSRAEKAPIR